jgi:hypothetical protein
VNCYCFKSIRIATQSEENLILDIDHTIKRNGKNVDTQEPPVRQRWSMDVFITEQLRRDELQANIYGRDSYNKS